VRPDVRLQLQGAAGTRLWVRGGGLGGWWVGWGGGWVGGVGRAWVGGVVGG
jgi:hypothetical protein